MAFYDRMPYTDIHNLNLDWIINAMKKLEEDWEHYGATVSASAHASDQPEVTVTGDFRSSVNFDFGIVRGPAGPRGEIGERGPKGETGSGLEIKDTYPTVQALKQAHPVGAEGDAYLIGVSPDFFLYIWSTSSNDYENVGSLSSPSPAITEPLMDGAADIGMENRYARADHRHPADSGKLDLKTNEGTTVEVYAFTGNAQNSIRVTDQPEAGKVVMYDEVNGNVNTGTATANSNAINKGTFDGAIADLENEISEKQDKLIAGTNFALINGTSLLNRTFLGIKSIGGAVGEGVGMLYNAEDAPEDKYVHLKTVNGESIVGDGDITVTGGGFGGIDTDRVLAMLPLEGPSSARTYTATEDCWCYVISIMIWNVTPPRPSINEIAFGSGNDVSRSSYFVPLKAGQTFYMAETTGYPGMLTAFGVKN